MRHKDSRPLPPRCLRDIAGAARRRVSTSVAGLGKTSTSNTPLETAAVAATDKGAVACLRLLLDAGAAPTRAAIAAARRSANHAAEAYLVLSRRERRRAPVVDAPPSPPPPPPAAEPRPVEPRGR